MHKVLAICVMIAFGGLSQEAGAPSEWNYDSYRKAYPEQLCRATSSQSGKKELEPALQFRRANEPAARDNTELRQAVLDTWRDLLGPSARNKGPLEVQVLEETDLPKYTRKKIQFTGDPGEKI